MKNYYLVGVALFMVTGGLLYKHGAHGMKRAREESSTVISEIPKLQTLAFKRWFQDQQITADSVEQVINDILAMADAMGFEGTHSDGASNIPDEWKVIIEELNAPVVLWQAEPGQRIGERNYQMKPNRALVFILIDQDKHPREVTHVLLIDTQTAQVLDKILQFYTLPNNPISDNNSIVFRYSTDMGLLTEDPVGKIHSKGLYDEEQEDFEEERHRYSPAQPASLPIEIKQNSVVAYPSAINWQEMLRNYARFRTVPIRAGGASAGD